jgi:uncharacterized secreted protein with C-terminal beta-propeller domain
MSRRLVSLIGVVLVAALGGATASSALKPPPAASVRPRAFASCPALVSYAQANLARTHGIPETPILALDGPVVAPVAKGVGVATPGAVSAAAAGGNDGASPAAEAYSTTNDQEVGVDEPDIVKTDGSTLFTLSGTRIEAVSVSGTPTLVGSLDLGSNGYNAQLLLRGNRLIAISQAAPRYLPLPGPIQAAPSAVRSSPYFAYGASTQLTEINVSDPSAMAITQTLTIDGSFVDARQAGSSARIVISSAPRAIPLPALQTSTTGWVPTSRFNDVRTGRHFIRPVAACSDIRRPVDFSGLGMLSIVTLDFDKGLGAAHTDSLMADAQIVYGSPTSLYLATQEWINPALSVAQLPIGQTTVIDKFDVSDPDTTTFVASGEVPGYLLNQFSMSESGQYLRVASTSRPIWWGGVAVNGGTPSFPVSQSYVTVLQPSNGVLAPVGQVSGLGQGEQITSVRFIGDIGYVVTFHQVDPLYTVDLSTPTAPKVVGQLDLAGYSAYLHPVGDGLLLGVGTDVSTDNEPSGSQLELFDVSDPAAPKLLAKTLIGSGSSTQVTYDHHAFLYWAPANLAVLPVQINPISYVTPTPAGGGGVAVSPTPGASFTGAIGYKLSSGGITELGRVVQDTTNGTTPQIERSVVVGSRLFTISTAGVMSSSLDTLQRQAYLPFPA